MQVPENYVLIFTDKTQFLDIGIETIHDIQSTNPKTLINKCRRHNNIKQGV